MPLVHRKVGPVKLSGGKLKVEKYDTEFNASNNATLANLLRQLASLVQLAGDIFTEVGDLTTQVGNRIHFVKLKLDEIDSKADLFDPKLVPVPEGSLDDPPISHKFRDVVLLNNMKYFTKKTRPKFLTQIYELAGSHEPSIPPRSPILGKHLFSDRVEQWRRPASFAALRDWKLDDYLDEKIAATLHSKQQQKSSLEAVNRAVAKSFPSQLVQVDVTGRGFDRMKSNRRSLVIHTKRIRIKKRRNTICGSMPNKECGIQTSFTSVAGGSADGHKKYGIDSGHWSSCTTSSAPAGPNSSSAPSPWDPNSLSTSPSDFLFEEEEQSLNSQLQNLTDGLVSDSDSVDTEGYFTSFRNECGFPKPKAKALFVKNSTTSTGGDDGETVVLVNGNDEASSSTFSSSNANNNSGDSEYELFGKGSTSSCGTVVMMRNKPEPPVRNNNSSSTENIDGEKKDDKEWEERVKRKSLIERVSSLVVITPSPSSPCSSVSPTFKNPGKISKDHQLEDSSDDKGTLTNGSESDTDSGELILEEISSAPINSRPRLERPCSSNSNESSVSTLTLTEEKSLESSTSLEKQGLFGDSRKQLRGCKDEKTTRFSIPDVIPDAQVLIRTGGTPKKLDLKREYLSLDTVPCRSFKEELHESSNNSNSENESKKSSSSATSGRIRGARVVLDANGEIIFSSETLRRKKRYKVSFDPGNAVKEQLYDSNSNYARIRESVYDRIKNSGENKEKLYETIEEIRRHNLKPSEKILSVEEERKCLISPTLPPNNNNNYLHSIINGRLAGNKSPSSMSNCSGRSSNNSNSPGHHPKVNILLETDLDSAIPPEMPELKNLPKIKDRLKRNESYRIATDEIPPLAINKNSLSALSNKKRLQLNSATSSPSPSMKERDRDNRKRDIPEENPAFIQQILSLSRNKAQSPTINGHSNKMTNLNNKSSTLDSTSAKFRLSKFAWSPLEDRPSFLRRDSSPTMDDIAKEIYRFRKKFNINPSPSTNSTETRKSLLTSSASFSVTPLRNAFNKAFPTNYFKGNSTPSISQTKEHKIPNGHVKKSYDDSSALNSKGTKDKIQSNGPPPPPRRHFPPSYQNPPKPIYPNINPNPTRTANTFNGEGIYSNSHKNTIPTTTKQASQHDQNGHLPNGGSFRRNFFGNKIFPVSYSFSGNTNQNQNNFNSNSSLNSNPKTNEVLLRGGWLSTNRMRNSISETTNLSARYKDRVLQPQNCISAPLNSQTSLGDFKRLLQATQRSSMKRNSISAVEILKPKFSQQETTL